jgi:heavy metal sensor kinase
MSSAKTRRLGLQTRLVLWTSLVLAVSFAAGFAWVHEGLRHVLEGRNDAFLERKAEELLAVVQGRHPGETSELEAEIRREVSAYEPEGLIVVVREPGRISISPQTAAARRLAAEPLPVGKPRTIGLDGGPHPYRVLVAPSRVGGLSIELGISLAETTATLAAFDRMVAGYAVGFLALAVVGGMILAHQAIRPVGESVRAARLLNPEDLSARLPLTGAGDELDQLAAAFNGLLDRLAAYHDQVIRFTADASHELRSPLGAIRAAIEVALQQPRDSEEYRRILASLGEQCERLTSLVNALLLLARADAGEVAIDREPIDLAAIASEVVEMFEPLAEERGVRLAAEAASPVVIEGDLSRIRQLITNLVDNAIRFTQPGGSVTVRVESVDAASRLSWVSLSVIDTGVGIPEEHLRHIFERFYRVDAARASGGCGLGLSICRWIVEAHGGRIEARSRPGEGTTFTAMLPTPGSRSVPLMLAYGSSRGD